MIFEVFFTWRYFIVDWFDQWTKWTTYKLVIIYKSYSLIIILSLVYTRYIISVNCKLPYSCVIRFRLCGAPGRICTKSIV